MTDLSAEFKALATYRPLHKVRFVTAASLFDGHDAAINIMRRILQGMGCEVVHLGHNRSVEEVVTAALQEDVQGIAISSYQGGHVEYFKYMVDLLKSRGGAHIQVFGGGGGVIVPAEIRELQGYGVARIYSPEDGQRMGLQGMIGEMVMRADTDLTVHAPKDVAALQGHTDAAWRALAQALTALENGKAEPAFKSALAAAAGAKKIPVLGITGTGGAGKSSLTDELIRRLRLDQGDALRCRPDGARAQGRPGLARPQRRRLACPGPGHHRARGWPRRPGFPGCVAAGGGGVQSARAGHHRHRRRGQEFADR